MITHMLAPRDGMLYLICERRINKDENERVTDGFGKKKRRVHTIDNADLSQEKGGNN